MKFASILCSLLLFVLVVLLTFQYEAFSLGEEELPNSFTYNQEIEVTFDKGNLNVVQHFTGLPEKRLSILWPAESGQAGCAPGMECERLTPDLSVLQEGEGEALSISYDIPFENKATMIHAPFAKIQGGEVGRSILHLTDREKSGGTWLTGLPIIGQQLLTYVDYYLFAGEGDVKELFRQEEKLSLAYKNDTFSLYSREMPSRSFKKTLNTISFPKHVDIVVGDKRRTGTNRILFIRQGSEEVVERDMAIATIQSSFSLNEEEKVFLSVMANLLTNQLEGNRLAQALTGELNALTAEQISSFLDRFWHQRGKELNAELLDSILSEALDGPVSFFKRNEIDQPFFPLVLDESRAVFFEGNPMELDVIRKDNRVLYSLAPLMETLNYSMSEGEHGLYLDNGNRDFRFPVKEPFYVLNERRYDAPTEPITKIAGKYYVEEKWLSLLFLLDVNKEEELIRIERMEGF